MERLVRGQLAHLGCRGLAAWQAWRTTLTAHAATTFGRDERDERGEGVISLAIAVLIVAFLGAAAWLAFKGLLDTTREKAESQIARVGG